MRNFSGAHELRASVRNLHLIVAPAAPDGTLTLYKINRGTSTIMRRLGGKSGFKLSAHVSCP